MWPVTRVESTVTPAKVIFVLNSLIIGGSERKTVVLANALKRRGWAVHIAFLNSRDLSLQPLMEFIDENIPVICLERRKRYSLPAVARLRRYLHHYRIELVVCVNLHPLAYAAPAVIGLRKARIKLVGMVNTTSFASLREARFMVLYRRLLAFTDAVVFGCSHQMTQWSDRYRLNPFKCRYIYNGIDTKEFCPEYDVGNDALPSRPGESVVVIGTVGQLRPEKNHLELIAAIKRLVENGNRLRVLVVGDGSEREALQRRVKLARLDAIVELCGEIMDVKSKLEMMDIFVLTSRSETFSNAALEAMAMAKPVVMSRVGGAQEMVVEGYNGYLYESGQPDVLAALLERLITDEDERDRLGGNARRLAVERFQRTRMIDDFERILVSLRAGINEIR